MDTLQTPSGIPYLAYLSGLNLGQGGQSGVTDPSLSGQTAGGKGGLGGASGGLGLDELSALLAAQQASDIVGAGTGQTLQTGIGLLGGFGNLGQGPGGFGAGGVLTQNPQLQGNAGIAGSSAGGGIDPMAVIKQALGLVQKGAGLLPSTQGSYGTAGDTGVSLSDQLRSGQAGVASPTIDLLGQGVLAANTLSDSLRSIPQGTVSVGQPQITGYGSSTTPDFTLTNQLQGGTAQAIPPGLAALGVTPDNLPQFMQAMSTLPPEAVQQFQAEMGMGGPQATPTAGYQSATPPTSGSNLGGAAQGGIGGLLGLLNLVQGAQTGNTTQDISGLLQSIGGFSNLLRNTPQLADALGLSSGALGTTGAAAGGLGGLLGLYGGIQGLTSGTGTAGSEISQLGGGALSTYSALSTLFPDLFPSVSSLLGAGAGAGGSVLGGVGTGAASTAGAAAGSGAAGSGVAAGTGGTAASGLGSGVAGGIAAAPLLAIVLANTISGMLDTQHAGYGAAENYRKLTGDLPQAIQSLYGLPGAFNQLPQQGGTPEQAQAELSGIQDIIGPWLNSGLYNFTQTGETSARGGGSGQDVSIKFPQGPGIFKNLFEPAFNAAEQQAIRGYDTLGAAGQTFAGQPDPASILGLNFSPYNLGLQEIQRLNPNYQLVPSPEAIASAGPTPWQTPPAGFSYYGGRYVPTDVMNDLLALRSDQGGLMSGIQNIVSKEQAGGYAPIAAPSSLAAANAASQYDPTLAPTAEQIASQYGTLPWLG